MEQTHRCMVCGDPSDLRPHYGRYYCREHLAAFHQDSPVLWRTSVFTFVLAVLLIVILSASNLFIGERVNDTARTAISIGVSLFPGLVWFVLLYRTAATLKTPVPREIQLLTIIAIFVAAAGVHPFLKDLLHIEAWLSRISSVTRLIALILLEGMPEAFALYATILFSVWGSREFSRRVDGILYALSFALGYSGTQNLLFVLDHPGLTLLEGNLRLVSMQAAMIAPSILLGYFAGHNRFEDMPPYFMGIGVLAAAIVNGLMLFIGTELNRTSLGITEAGFSPWPGLIVNMLLLGVIFALIRGLVRRQNDLIRAN